MESQPTDGGYVETVDKVVADIQANGLVRNVTISGGEPFEQPEAAAELAARLKRLGYGVWVYTGYLYEDLLARAEEIPAIRTLLECADVLVDGPFIEARKSLGLKWRGSSNQRLIDMPATLRSGGVVLWEKHDDFPTKPASW